MMSLRLAYLGGLLLPIILPALAYVIGALWLRDVDSHPLIAYPFLVTMVYAVPYLLSVVIFCFWQAHKPIHAVRKNLWWLPILFAAITVTAYSLLLLHPKIFAGVQKIVLIMKYSVLYGFSCVIFARVLAWLLIKSGVVRTE